MRVKFKSRWGVSTVVAIGLLATSVQAGDGTDLFRNGFENAGQPAELLEDKGGPWESLQFSYPENTATLEQDSEQGTYLRFHARSRSEPVSKSLIEVAALSLQLDEGVWIRFRLRVPDRVSLDKLFIADLECRACWPDNVEQSNPSPGIRLVLDGADGAPAVERKKLGGEPETWRQSRADRVAVPRGRWMDMAWFVQLSPLKGRSQIVVDDACILDRVGRTVPDEAAILAEEKVRLRQPVSYDRVQLGITANASMDPMMLDIDSVEIRRGAAMESCQKADHGR